MEIVWVTAACHSGGCIEIADIGGDWFRVRSNNLKTAMIAVTGTELRGFFDAVKAGQFDELVAPVRSA